MKTRIRVDARDLVKELGLKARDAGKEFECWCPICSRQKLWINSRTAQWKCFYCAKAGGALALVMHVLKLDPDDGSRWLRRNFGDREGRTIDDARRRCKLTLEDDRDAVHPVDLPREARVPSGEAMDYLVRRRGLTKEVIDRFGVRFCRTGLYAGRVVVPIPGPDGNLPYSFVSRSIRDGVKPPYLYPTGPRTSETLSGFPDANEIVLVEGIFDAMAWAARGVWTAAIFGSSLSDEQAGLVVEKYDRVTLALDGDAAGLKGTKRAMEKLAGLVDLYVTRLPEGTDPATCDPLILLSVKRASRTPEKSRRGPLDSHAISA